MKIFSITPLAFGIGLLIGGVAVAQPARPAAPGASPGPAAATPTFATATPGVCLLSRDGAIGGSKAGQEATIHMQQLANDISNELSAQRGAIGQGNDLSQSVQQRAQAVAQLEQLRGAQLQRTKLLAEQQIAGALGGAIVPVVTAAKCSVIFERGNSYGWNPAMDITPQVILELDKRLPLIQFSLAPPESVIR